MFKKARQCLANVKMYNYTKFDQNIPCGSRVMSIFTQRSRPAKMMLNEASSSFAYQCLDNVKMYKYAKFNLNIPCRSRAMSISTN